MEHLCGHDDRLLGTYALTRYLTLYRWYLLKGHLNTKVATGNHDAVARFDNIVDIVHTLLILNL